MSKIYEYRWQALDRFQQKRKGKQLARSREEFEFLLLSKGYQQIKISRNFVLVQNPKVEEINQFFSQLALLVNSAISLKQALIMVIQNCHNIKFYQWLNELINLIESGYSFSQSLEKLACYITHQEIQLIKMGEQSGKLGTILVNLAESRMKSEKLVKKVKKILFYPAIVLVISILLSLGLLLFIVPQFAELYGSKGKTLPFITETLFSFSQFLQEQGNIMLIALLQSVIFFILFARKRNWMAALKVQILGKLPVFRQILIYSRIVFFGQNLALMLDAHIRLDAALHTFLSEKNEDPILQKEIRFMRSLLQRGYKFSEGINPTIFSTEVVQMIDIGERSGNLAEMCVHINKLYQQKLDHQIDMISQLLEPMLMLLIGLIIGTIIIALYLPIFDMGSLMG